MRQLHMTVRTRNDYCGYATTLCSHLSPLYHNNVGLLFSPLSRSFLFLLLLLFRCAGPDKVRGIAKVLANVAHF